MPTIVLLSPLVSPPAAKKQPAAMNPTQTRAKPPRGPSAIKAQMPPSTATLTDNASNSVMVSSVDLMLRGPRIHLESFIAVFLGIARLIKPRYRQYRGRLPQDHRSAW